MPSILQTANRVTNRYNHTLSFMAEHKIQFTQQMMDAYIHEDIENLTWVMSSLVVLSTNNDPS